MKKLLFTFAFMFFAAVSWAQNCKISGAVLSQTDSIPVAGARIIASKIDGSQQKGTLSDDKGTFSLTIDYSDILLEISFLGYEDYNAKLEGSKNNVDLGNIFLRTDVLAIDEVVVTASNQTNRIDKSVIFPSSQQVKQSRGSIELLGMMNLPGLEVNSIERKISINGAQPVYLINGVPKTINDILALNPQNIARIEYSNTPSIRYVDRGSGGEINVILKERQDGGSLFAQTLFSPTTGFVNSNLYGSYSHKKSEVAFSYFNDYRHYSDRLTNRHESFIGDDFEINRDFSGVDSPFGYFNQGIDLTYTYQHNEKTMFSATLSNNMGNQYNSVDGTISQTLMPSFFRRSRSESRSNIPSLDLFFTKGLANKQTLEFNVVATLMDGAYNRNLTDTQENNATYIDNKVDNSRRSIISEVAYKKRFENNILLSFGYQNTISQTQNKYQSTVYSLDELNENNNYLYGQISGTFSKKVSYSVGTGAKLFYVRDLKDNRTFIKNRSTLSLMYNVSSKLNFRFNTLYNPILPSLSQLSGVEQPYDNILIIKGNPNLKAAQAWNNSITANFNHNKFSANLVAAYDKIYNPIFADVYYRADGVFVSQYTNFKSGERLGAEMKLSYRGLGNHFDIYGTVGYNDYRSCADNLNLHYSNFYWNISAQAYWGNWTVSAFYNQPRRTLSGLVTYQGENNSQITLQYRHKNLLCFAAVKYPFQPQGWYYNESSASQVNPYFNEVKIKANGNMVLLGVTYSLDMGKGFKKSNKNLNNSDSENSIVKVQQ